MRARRLAETPARLRAPQCAWEGGASGAGGWGTQLPVEGSTIVVRVPWVMPTCCSALLNVVDT